MDGIFQDNAERRESASWLAAISQETEEARAAAYEAVMVYWGFPEGDAEREGHELTMDSRRIWEESVYEPMSPSWRTHHFVQAYRAAAFAVHAASWGGAARGMYADWLDERGHAEAAHEWREGLVTIAKHQALGSWFSRKALVEGNLPTQYSVCGVGIWATAGTEDQATFRGKAALGVDYWTAGEGKLLQLVKCRWWFASRLLPRTKSLFSGAGSVAVIPELNPRRMLSTFPIEDRTHYREPGTGTGESQEERTGTWSHQMTVPGSSWSASPLQGFASGSPNVKPEPFGVVESVNEDGTAVVLVNGSANRLAVRSLPAGASPGFYLTAEAMGIVSRAAWEAGAAARRQVDQHAMDAIRYVNSWGVPPLPRGVLMGEPQRERDERRERRERERAQRHEEQERTHAARRASRTPAEQEVINARRQARRDARLAARDPEAFRLQYQNEPAPEAAPDDYENGADERAREGGDWETFEEFQRDYPGARYPDE